MVASESGSGVGGNGEEASNGVVNEGDNSRIPAISDSNSIETVNQNQNQNQNQNESEKRDGAENENRMDVMKDIKENEQKDPQNETPAHNETPTQNETPTHNETPTPSIFPGMDLVSLMASTPESRLEHIHTELALLHSQYDAAALQPAFSLLSRILHNIVPPFPSFFAHSQLRDPASLTLRTLNPASDLFQKRFAPLGGVVEIFAQLGFRSLSTEKGPRLVLADALLDLDLLKSVIDVLPSDPAPAQPAKSPLTKPGEAPSEAPSEAFDPTKPMLLTTMQLSDKTKTTEKRVQELEMRMEQFESEVPERDLMVFRSENGVNPRNFGADVESKMMHLSDVAYSATLPANPSSASSSASASDSMEDSRLISEVLERKKRVAESNAQLKTRAQRELEALQRQRMYKRTTVRVHLPDATVIQAYFAPRETIADVMGVVRMVLVGRAESLPFYLFRTPPKERYCCLGSAM